MEKIYTLQIDGHANFIICGDTRERSGYRTIKSGTYKECLIARETAKKSLGFSRV